ncbi:hypothetical protein DV737_g593, partial [Chaetothyriales sp. CBS 132003]
MSGKYSRDDLYKLRASPLIGKPTNLAAIVEICAAADVKTQRPPARRGADDANGATEAFVGRPLDSHRKSTTDPDRIVLGPPRRSFASSNAKGPGRGAAAENGDDDQPPREKSGFGRFKDGDADRFPDKRINGRFSRHEPADSAEEKPRRRFDNAHGDDRPRKDHERKPKWALDDADGGDKDPKPERLSRSKFEQSWLRPDRGAESLDDGRREGDRAPEWRGKKQDRGWDRAAAVEDDPEWLDAPVDEAKQAPARTQEDFQRWKEKMKAGKTAPATEETAAVPSSPEPHVNKPTKSFAPIPDAEADDSMDKFLARFDKTKITSEKAAATKAPTKTRFASLFSPSPDSVQAGGATGLQPQVEQQQVQPVQYAHREVVTPASQEPPVDPDQAGFARIMEMLKNRSNSQTPQSQEQKPKATLPLYARDGHPPPDSDLSQHRLPLTALFGGGPQDTTDVPLASTQDHLQECRLPVDAQHAREPSEKNPFLLDLLKQANQAAKPTPPRPRYGNEILMGPINEASMRDMSNHSATYAHPMISPDPAVLPHYGRMENGRSPPLEDLGRRPTNAEGQQLPDQLLNFVRGYNQAPKPTNYQPHAPLPPGIGRPPGLDTLSRPPPGWPGSASVPPQPQPQSRQPAPPPGMPGGARNLGPAQFGGPGMVQGQRPQPPRKYTSDFPPGPPPGFMSVPPPGFQGYGGPQGLPRPQFMDMHAETDICQNETPLAIKSTPSFYLKGDELFEFLCMTERDRDPTELNKLVCGLCHSLHPRQAFPSSEVTQPPRERDCRQVWLCPHKHMGYAKTIKLIKAGVDSPFRAENIAPCSRCREAIRNRSVADRPEKGSSQIHLENPRSESLLISKIGLMQAPSPVYNAKAHNGTSGMYKEVFQVKDVSAALQAINFQLCPHLSLDPEVQESLKDYSMTNPLLADGSDFACKKYQYTETNSQANDIKAVYQAGSTYNMTIAGTATHMGGSCQISLSYDNGATFKVIESQIGGCSLTLTHNFTIPSFAPSSDSVLLSWSWFNLLGNREMYQNCARISIQNQSQPIPRYRRALSKRQASLDDLPNMFVCNLGDGCTTIERSEVVFPDPGDNIVYGYDGVTLNPGPGYTLASQSTQQRNNFERHKYAVPHYHKLTFYKLIQHSHFGHEIDQLLLDINFSNQITKHTAVIECYRINNLYQWYSITNPYGYYSITNPYGYYSITNPYGCYSITNPYGYYSINNPYGCYKLHLLGTSSLVVVMGYPDTFEGFVISDQKKWTEFKKQEIKPKKFGDNDIDIKIECCGVCGSDLHTINGGWGEAPLPICVGHEIVGHAVRVGPEVKTVKVGDRVGVGAQIWACLKCAVCKSDNENYCPHQVDTYGAPYPKSEDPDETISQGGYASHVRAHEYFTFPIPDNIPSESAAPMMCAGLTVWSPLVRSGVGPGKQVAIVGFGGLGHFGVIWANALGAEVTVISHSPHKKDDALKLGAKHFVVSSGDNWEKPLAFKFDMVLNTADMTHTFDIQKYLSICAVNAHFHQVGLPDEALPAIKAQQFMANGSSIGASHIGSRPEMLAMLKLASEKNLLPMVETLPVGEEGCAEAVERVSKNKVKYRFTLVDYDKAFPHRP